MNGRVLGGIARSLRRQFAVRRSPVDWARAQGATVGTDCRFLGIGPETLGSEPYLVSIGNHVTITSGVRFVTHDGGVWVLRGEHPGLDVFGRNHRGQQCIHWTGKHHFAGRHDRRRCCDRGGFPCQQRHPQSERRCRGPSQGCLKSRGLPPTECRPRLVHQGAQSGGKALSCAFGNAFRRRRVVHRVRNAPAARSRSNSEL